MRAVHGRGPEAGGTESPCRATHVLARRARRAPGAGAGAGRQGRAHRRVLAGDHCGDALAQRVVWQADNRALGHRRVRQQHVFDAQRADLVAGALDDVHARAAQDAPVGRVAVHDARVAGPARSGQSLCRKGECSAGCRSLLAMDRVLGSAHLRERFGSNLTEGTIRHGGKPVGGCCQTPAGGSQHSRDQTVFTHAAVSASHCASMRQRWLRM